VTDEFHGDETLLIFYGTQSFSLHAMPAKLMIFNAMKSSMKLPLRLVLCAFIEEAFVTILSTPCIWNLICQTAKLTKIGDVIVCTKVLVVPPNRHLVWCIVNLKWHGHCDLMNFVLFQKKKQWQVRTGERQATIPFQEVAGAGLEIQDVGGDPQGQR